MKKVILTALLGGLVASSAAYATENISKAMTKVYGPYDRFQQCWILKDDFSYCMKIAKVDAVKDEDGSKTVYLLAKGDAIEAQGHIHVYSQGGRIGMIVYKSDDAGNTQIIASRKNEPAGIDGDAPNINSFSFVKLGPQHWGWRLDDQTVHQGNGNTYSTVYTPYQNTIRPVFELLTHDSRYDWEISDIREIINRDVRIKDNSETDDQFYPIEVRVFKTADEEVKPGKYIFTFNSSQQKYIPPPGSSIAIDLANRGM